MKYVHVYALHPVENLVYKVLWIIFLCSWVSGLVGIFVLSNPGIWLGVSAAGWVGASVFSRALKDQSQIWPFSRYWPKPVLKETRWEVP